MAVHAPDALKMLGKQATYDEMRVLGAFQYVYRYCRQFPVSMILITIGVST